MLSVPESAQCYGCLSHWEHYVLAFVRRVNEQNTCHVNFSYEYSSDIYMSILTNRYRRYTKLFYIYVMQLQLVYTILFNYETFILGNINHARLLITNEVNVMF